MLAKCLCSKPPRGKKVKEFIIPSYTEKIANFEFAGIRICSIQYIEILARNAKCGIVEAIGKGIQLFIYGRDLFEGSYRIISKTNCAANYVAVFSKDMFLGIGKIKSKIIKNVIDVGIYLRDETSAAFKKYIC